MCRCNVPRCKKTDFFNREYDAAIAVGLIFLLPTSDQLKLIASVSRRLRPGGRFVFTAPIEVGEWLDMNTGLECRSLGRDIYEKHLCGAGFRVLPTFADKGANNYYDVELVASGPDGLDAQ
jgi:SAM-dependent methyltransferase